jgi:hypothetical protein
MMAALNARRNLEDQDRGTGGLFQGGQAWIGLELARMRGSGVGLLVFCQGGRNSFGRFWLRAALQ